MMRFSITQGLDIQATVLLFPAVNHHSVRLRKPEAVSLEVSKGDVRG